MVVSNDYKKFGTDMLDEFIRWINTNLHPEDVFDVNELDDWATENGYRKE